MQEEIKSIMKSGNACYHSAQSLLSSSSLSEKINIKIYRNIILSIVMHGCETWLLTLREKCRLRVCENRVLSRYFGLGGTRKRGSGENYIMKSLMTYTLHQILFW